MTEDLARKEESAIDVSSRRGHETPVDNSDLMIPRAKLLQALSPEVQDDPKRFFQGMILNSITKEELPKDDQGWITFIPIMRSVNWLRFNPQSDKDPDFNPEFEAGAIIWRSNNPSDPRVIAEGAWGPKSEPPKATKFINYLALVPGHSMPIVISFGKTSFKAGKALSTMTQFAPGDLFSWRYRLRSKKEQNDAKQQYFVLVVEQCGQCPKDEFQKAESIYKTFAGKELKVHEESEEETAQPQTTKNPWD